MKVLVTAITFFLTSYLALSGNGTLIHKWIQKSSTEFESSYKTTAPFNSVSPVEATLSLVAVQRGDVKSLDDLLANEVKGIKGQVKVAEYPEEDRPQPKDNIAVWKEKLDGSEVGFIKYRAVAAPDKPPFTVIHGLVLGKTKIMYVHLSTYFGAHQDEVRADQISLMKSSVKNSK